MATNDSTTGTFLVPIASPEHDAALDDALHDTVVGLLGLEPELVRPRWQPNPPNQPMYTTNWVAFGVVSTEPDAFAYEGHQGAEDGSASLSVIERDELLRVLMSFYGPDASKNDAQFRAGLQLVQNRFLLDAIHVGVVEHQAPVKVPALMKETWVPRVDSTLILRRRSVHTFQVRSFERPSGMLDNEHYLTPILYKQDSPLP